MHYISSSILDIIIIITITTTTFCTYKLLCSLKLLLVLTVSLFGRHWWM